MDRRGHAEARDRESAAAAAPRRPGTAAFRPGTASGAVIGAPGITVPATTATPGLQRPQTAQQPLLLRLGSSSGSRGGGSTTERDPFAQLYRHRPATGGGYYARQEAQVARQTLAFPLLAAAADDKGSKVASVTNATTTTTATTTTPPTTTTEKMVRMRTTRNGRPAPRSAATTTSTIAPHRRTTNDTKRKMALMANAAVVVDLSSVLRSTAMKTLSRPPPPNHPTTKYAPSQHPASAPHPQADWNDEDDNDKEPRGNPSHRRRDDTPEDAEFSEMFPEPEEYHQDKEEVVEAAEAVGPLVDDDLLPLVEELARQPWDGVGGVGDDGAVDVADDGEPPATDATATATAVVTVVTVAGKPRAVQAVQPKVMPAPDVIDNATATATQRRRRRKLQSAPPLSRTTAATSYVPAPVPVVRAARADPSRSRSAAAFRSLSTATLSTTRTPTTTILTPPRTTTTPAVRKQLTAAIRLTDVQRHRTVLLHRPTARANVDHRHHFECILLERLRSVLEDDGGDGGDGYDGDKNRHHHQCTEDHLRIARELQRHEAAASGGGSAIGSASGGGSAIGGTTAGGISGAGGIPRKLIQQYFGADCTTIEQVCRSIEDKLRGSAVGSAAVAVATSSSSTSSSFGSSSPLATLAPFAPPRALSPPPPTATATATTTRRAATARGPTRIPNDMLYIMSILEDAHQSVRY